MHFAYPARKSSNPPPFRPRSTVISPLRRRQLKTAALIGGFVLFIIWMLSGSSSSKPSKPKKRVIAGEPTVVLVTVLDEESRSVEYLNNVKDNRIQYAEIHGYGTVFAKPDDYFKKTDPYGFDEDTPHSWAKVVGSRHALTKYPDCKYLWFLDTDAFIMNPSLKIEDIMTAENLKEKSALGIPVVPPDSIIKTYEGQNPEDVELVLTQDRTSLSSGNFILKNGEWAKFFLETWFDPLYRSYNFRKAEQHALEHVVQWHPTVLEKLAIIPQRTFNSHATSKYGVPYMDGDLVVRFSHCSTHGGTDDDCYKLAEKYLLQWRTAFHNHRP